MTQEEKDLLLKDLCARLPYGVKVHDEVENTIFEIESINTYECVCPKDENYQLNIEDNGIKPYLFPLSSMTNEHKKDIFRNGTFFFDRHNTLCRFPKHNDDYDYATFEDYLDITEKLNKNHFDYRGLIEKGLALDATGLNIY